jgi:hypothetical protein
MGRTRVTRNVHEANTRVFLPKRTCDTPAADAARLFKIPTTVAPFLARSPNPPPREDRIRKIAPKKSRKIIPNGCFTGIATQRRVPEAALSYFISPFVKRPHEVRIKVVSATPLARRARDIVMTRRDVITYRQVGLRRDRNPIDPR